MQATITTVSQRIYGFFSWLIFISVIIPTICLLAVIPGQLNRRVIAKKAAALIFFVTGVTPRVIGYENLPDEGSVVVANHASYLDGIILTAVLPPRFTFVIKREMSRIPFASFLLRRIGSEFVDRARNQRNMIDARRIMYVAGTGRSLVFFPEGSIRHETGLRHFHQGAFAAAKRGNLKLAPVAIRGSRDMLPAKQVLPIRATLEVVIKPAISPESAQTSIRDLLQVCRNSILEDLNEPDTP